MDRLTDEQLKWIAGGALDGLTKTVNQENDMKAMATELLELREENHRIRDDLSESRRGGTPYSRERDGINSMIIEIQNLHAENERLREEVERLRKGLHFLNDQLPINSALKPHIAGMLPCLTD